MARTFAEPRGIQPWQFSGRSTRGRATRRGQAKMNAPTEMGPRAALSDYLAAERTLLAWIRTGLALMGFGFVVARFGLFLQELAAVGSVSSAQSYGLSLWFGTALIAMGVLVNLFAGWQHARLVKELDRGGPTHARPAAPAVAIALFLALVGLAMTIYLISLRGSAPSSGGSNSRNNQEEMPMSQTAPATDNGIISKPSNHSVDQTVSQELLQNIAVVGTLADKGRRVSPLSDGDCEAAEGAPISTSC